MSDNFSSVLKALFGGTRDLQEMLPYLFEENDEVIATKNGALVTAIRIAGIDAYTSDESELDHLSDALSEIVDKSGNNFSFHFHKLQSKYHDFDYQPKPFVETGFAKEMDEAWRQHITSSGLCMPALFLSIVERKAIAERLPIFGELWSKRKLDGISDRINDLQELAHSAKETLGRGSEVLRIADGSFLGYLRGISTGFYSPLARSEQGTVVDDIRVPTEMFDRAVEVNDEFDTRFASVISIHNLSPLTHRGMLDALYSDPDIAISSSFEPFLEDLVAGKATTRLEQTLEEAGGGKIAAQLLDAAEDLKLGHIGFGDSQTSITIYAETPEALRKKTIAITALLKSKRLKIVTEKRGLSAAWFSRFPANFDFHNRPLTISNKNFSDFAALHMVQLGKPASECFWGTPVTTFKSCANTPFDFSFHGRRKDDHEPPFASTLFVGPPDTGKSTITAFVAAQVRRSRPRIIAIDYDHSLEMPLRALGGTYTSVRAGVNTGLNPLATETDEEGQAWLRGWLTSLIQDRGDKLTVSDGEKLARAVRSNAENDAQFQDFTNFATRFQSFEGDIGARISEWSPEGQYGWVFGKDRAPIVDFSSSSIVGVDLTSIEKLQLERTALLAYLFRQIQKTVDEREPTLLIVEEAGIYLDDPYFQRVIRTWLDTLRKKNVVVLMLCQYVSQIRATAAGDSIIEGLQNQLILPHHQATLDSYKGINLSDAELSFLMAPQSGKRRALWRDGQSSNILNIDLSALGKHLAVLTGGPSAERIFGRDWREKSEFWKGDNQ